MPKTRVEAKRRCDNEWVGRVEGEGQGECRQWTRWGLAGAGPCFPAMKLKAEPRAEGLKYTPIVEAPILQLKIFSFVGVHQTYF